LKKGEKKLYSVVNDIGQAQNLLSEKFVDNNVPLNPNNLNYLPISQYIIDYVKN